MGFISEELIEAAEGLATDEEIIEMSLSSKFDGLDGEDRLNAARLNLIYLNGCADDATGDTATFSGFYWRVGMFIAGENSQGFIDFEGFATVEDAEAKMSKIHYGKESHAC